MAEVFSTPPGDVDVGLAEALAVGLATGVGGGAPEGVTGAEIADHPELPFTLVALTWNVYELPLASPPNATDSDEPETVTSLPRELMIVYTVIGHTLAAAAHLTVAAPLAGVAETDVGAEGVARLNQQLSPAERKPATELDEVVTGQLQSLLSLK